MFMILTSFTFGGIKLSNLASFTSILLNGRKNEHKRLDERTEELTDERTDEQTDEQMDEPTDS